MEWSVSAWQYPSLRMYVAPPFPLKIVLTFFLRNHEKSLPSKKLLTGDRARGMKKHVLAEPYLILAGIGHARIISRPEKMDGNNSRAIPVAGAPRDDDVWRYSSFHIIQIVAIHSRNNCASNCENKVWYYNSPCRFWNSVQAQPRVDPSTEGDGRGYLFRLSYLHVFCTYFSLSCTYCYQ